MHICFISSGIFAWGKYGGFGRATRTIARELIKRGIQVSAIVPQRKGQKTIEDLEGIKVYGFKIYNPFSIIKIAKNINASIYHSQEPSFSTFLVKLFLPNNSHMVTCRDTRDAEDWQTERKYPTKNSFQVILNQLYEDNPLVVQAVRNSPNVYAASKSIQEKAKKRYKLIQLPGFLPTPVFVPDKNSLSKHDSPVVCFVSRWDRRKRPEIFFTLARQFPEVQFKAVGSSHDKEWDSYLRKKHSNIPNLEMLGFANQFDTQILNDIYNKSWILINTSSREGLPNSFIEASAHSCAILSSVNPDQFASQFGYLAENDDFAAGLEYLLENNRWRKLGEAGYQYVKNTFSTEVAINKHIDIYNQIITKRIENYEK